MKLLKPKILKDIVSKKGSNTFSSLPNRLNLSKEKVFTIQLGTVSKALVVAGVVLFFVLGSVTAPTIFSRAAGSVNADERQVLEAQLTELEGQINTY